MSWSLWGTLSKMICNLDSILLYDVHVKMNLIRQVYVFLCSFGFVLFVIVSFKSLTTELSVSVPSSLSVLHSCCPQKKTVTAPTPVSPTASTGRPLEAGLRSWTNTDTRSTCLNTHRRRYSMFLIVLQRVALYFSMLFFRLHVK